MGGLLTLECYSGWSLSTMRQTDAEARAAWHPFICDFGCGQQAMIIAPGNLKLAIPRPLFRAEYARLPRVWLLKTRNDGGQGDDRDSTEKGFLLEGKSVLFASMPEDEYGECLKMCETRHMKVYGPNQGS